MKIENLSGDLFELCCEIEDQAEDAGLSYAANEMNSTEWAVNINSEYFLKRNGNLVRGKVTVTSTTEKTFTGDSWVNNYSHATSELYKLGKPKTVKQLIEMIEKD